jgi:hypothetical protein
VPRVTCACIKEAMTRPKRIAPINTKRGIVIPAEVLPPRDPDKGPFIVVRKGRGTTEIQDR